MENINIYNLQPKKRIKKQQFSITVDPVVKTQLEKFCHVTGFNRSEAIEAILANYLKPMLPEVDNEQKEDNT